MSCMKKGLFLILYCYIGMALTSYGQSWRAIEKQAMPKKISNNAVVEAHINGKDYVYSFGGIDSTKLFSGITNESFRYDVNLDEWDTIPALPDSNTKIAAAASYVNGIIYIIGGYSVFANGTEVSSKKVHRFDPVTNTYLTDATSIPVPIDDHVQAVYNDSLIYVVTGWSNTANIINVQIYNANSNKWAFGTSVPFGSYQVFGSTGTIIGDTIYYYGGARNGQFFPSSNHLRKGAIDPLDPTKITWQSAIIDTATFAYRPASTSVNGNPVWIGGSSISYNFNGIAYNGSGGVSPSNRSILYDISTAKIITSTPDTGFFPMDLRGLASISNMVKYIVGGMDSNQQVSNKTYRLEYVVPTEIEEHKGSNKIKLQSFPNPFRQELKITNNDRLRIRYKILDTSGKKLFTSSINANNETTINTSNWTRGLYILMIEKQGEILTKQLLKVD